MEKWLIFIVIGAVFFTLGVLSLFWGFREEKRIFESLSKKPDLREFSMKHVETPEPGSLKIGGWIAIALGVLMAVAGIIFWRTGWPLD